MNIAVIGAGAIGSTIAAYLSKSGQDITLIGRQDQVDAIASNGLRVSGVRGTETFNLQVALHIEKKYDMVIFTVKTPDIYDAYVQNHEYLDDALILTTQNGVQADNILSTHFEKENMISSIVMFGATYVKPGEVIFNFDGNWIIGRPFISNGLVVEEVADALRSAFSVEISNDIMGMKWLKLFVNFNNCLPALIGKSMQETFSDMDFCRISIMLLKEGIDIVNNAGIVLVSLPKFPSDRITGLVAMPQDQAAGIINKTLTSLSKEPLYGSILQSIIRKKPSEIDYINGEIALLAKNIGMTAPLNRKVVDMVHHVEHQGTFFDAKAVKEEFSLQ